MDQTVWLVVKRNKSIKSGDILYILLQTCRAVIETRSENVFRDRKALDKSQISQHGRILITWLLKAKEPCTNQGS